MKLHPEAELEDTNLYGDLSQPLAVRLNDGKHRMGNMGKCHRNAILGKPVLHDAHITTDWGLLDLWERSALYGKPEDLAHDPYVFKIVPLQVRTWIYHEYVTKLELVSKSAGEHAVMEAVLAHKVVDCPIKIAGRFSPALCCIPATFAAILVADYRTAFPGAIMVFFNVYMSKKCNCPRFFGYSRLITFLPRLLFYAYVWMRMIYLLADSMWRILGFMVIIGFLTADFIAGDCQYVASWGSRCCYEVLRVLPNRVFICRKHGAAFLPDPDAGRRFNEAVTGVSHFDEMVLIAEVQGLVVQMKPMDVADWRLAWEERTAKDSPIAFMGIDVFNMERRNVQEIDMSVAAETSDGAKAQLEAKIKSGKLARAGGDPELLE